MGLRKIFEESLGDVFDTAGEDAVYIPQDGTPLTCKMFIDYDVVMQPAGLQSETWEKGTTIELLLSQIGQIPARGDIVTYTDKGKSYTLLAPVENDGLSIVMMAKEIVD